MTTSGMRVAILGTGAIGLGAAAFLAESGHQPVIWSPSGTGAAELAQGARLEAKGALSGSYPIETATDCMDAIAGAEAVLIALPANGHRRVMDEAAPHLSRGQTVIISGHLSFGALYLARLLEDRGVSCRSWCGAPP